MRCGESVPGKVSDEIKKFEAREKADDVVTFFWGSTVGFVPKMIGHPRFFIAYITGFFLKK